MRLSKAGLIEIELSEGFSSRPYWDALGGVWTIGFGETNGITSRTKPITRAQAEDQLRKRFEKDYAPALRSFENLKGFNQNRYDALASFIWNCGTGAVSSSTKVGRLLRARRWSEAADAMLAWCKAGGRTVPGLLARRRRERALFLKNLTPRDTRGMLTKWEREQVEELEARRRTQKRNGGWSKVGPQHLRAAAKAKKELRARAKWLRGSDLSKAYRAERLAFIEKVVGD